jgi:hypothetical protein
MKKSKQKKLIIALWAFIAILLAGMGGLYSYVWHESARMVAEEYTNLMGNLRRNSDITPPIISGFPGPIKLSVLQETLDREPFSVTVQVMEISGWPIPYTPIKIKTGPIEISAYQWREPLTLNGLDAAFTFETLEAINLDHAILRKDDLRAGLSGMIDFSQQPMPRLDTVLSLSGFNDFIASLAQKNIIEERIAMFMNFGFDNLKDEDGMVRVPLLQRNDKLYAGPIPLLDLPDLFETPEEPPAQLPRLEPYNQLGPAQ